MTSELQEALTLTLEASGSGKPSTVFQRIRYPVLGENKDIFEWTFPEEAEDIHISSPNGRLLSRTATVSHGNLLQDKIFDSLLRQQVGLPSVPAAGALKGHHPASSRALLQVGKQDVDEDEDEDDSGKATEAAYRASKPQTTAYMATTTDLAKGPVQLPASACSASSRHDGGPAKPIGRTIRCTFDFPFISVEGEEHETKERLKAEREFIWVEMRYQVKPIYLGWAPSYQATVSQDNSVQLTTIFSITNRLPISFHRAKIIFSTVGSSASSSPSVSLSSKDRYSDSDGDGDYYSSTSSSSSSSSSSAYSSALEAVLLPTPNNKNKPKRVGESQHLYFGVREYFLGSTEEKDKESRTVTLLAGSNLDITYHRHQFPFDDEQCWFLFDACLEFQTPGVIYQEEYTVGSGPITTTDAPFVVSIQNTPENGFGIDLPNGRLKTYSLAPRVLPSLYHTGPLAQFCDLGFVSASAKGERLSIPLHMPKVSVLSCRKERTSFRLNNRPAIIESFTYTLENTASVEPLNVLIRDCAFRHSDWYIVRITPALPIDRFGPGFFSISVRGLAFGIKQEITLTIEYSLGGGAVGATPSSSAPPPTTLAPPPATDHHGDVSPRGSKKPQKGGFLSSLFGSSSS